MPADEVTRRLHTVGHLDLLIEAWHEPECAEPIGNDLVEHLSDDVLEILTDTSRYWITADESVASIPAAMPSIVFTHRLTRDELERDEIDGTIDFAIVGCDLDLDSDKISLTTGAP